MSTLSRDFQEKINMRVLRLRNQLQTIANSVQEAAALLNELGQELQILITDVQQIKGGNKQREKKGENKKEATQQT